MNALSIAASGMQAQQTNVDVISHNIANMNTTAYKRQRAEFEDMLYQNVERPGATSSASGNMSCSSPPVPCNKRRLHGTVPVPGRYTWRKDGGLIHRPLIRVCPATAGLWRDLV